MFPLNNPKRKDKVTSMTLNSLSGFIISSPCYPHACQLLNFPTHFESPWKSLTYLFIHSLNIA